MALIIPPSPHCSLRPATHLHPDTADSPPLSLSVVFNNWVLLCIPGWPGACCINQAGLEFTETRLLLPPKC